MSSPVFLDLGLVTRLHRSLVERYGGIDGVRDMGMLQSAVAMPEASFGGDYLHKDLFEMASAYHVPHRAESPVPRRQ
jgi:death-on-curing protein